MDSSKPGGESGECGVGSIVWVRRRNGSWWPGKILGPEELTTSHLTSPRSGTPVKLLGRDDASVDWYNLEKSKRVKAFRCGEFDDCIERAEASLGMPTRKREKYARREDAILHALELEKELLKKQGKLVVISDHVSHSSGSANKELITSSGALDISGGSSGNFISNLLPERSETLFKDTNVGSPLKFHKNKDREQTSLDDEHPEAIPRMRGLQDLGLRTALPKRKLLSPCVSDGSRKLTVDNNYQSSPSIVPGTGGTSLANGGEQAGGVFRAKRSRCVYLPAESVETLEYKEIPLPNQIETSHLQFEDGECFSHVDCSVEESSSGLMEDDETVSSVSESEADSSETEPDMDEAMTLVSGTSMVGEAEFRSKILQENGSTSSEEHEQSVLSGDTSHLHPHDPTANEAVSKWQLKGKRNIRHLSKCSVDGSDRSEFNGFIPGTYHEVKRVAFNQRALRQSMSFQRNNHYNEDVDEVDFDDRDFCSQMIRLDGGYGYRLRAASKGRNGISCKIIDWADMTSEDQPALSGHWGDRVEQFNPRLIGCYNFGNRTRSLLVDVDLKVQASYQKGRVPIISLMSKLNGNAIIGHPIQIEALEDGSSEYLISANNYFCNLVVDHDRMLPPAWRTARRTNLRVPRSALSSSLNGDLAVGSHSFLDEERRPFKKSNMGSFSYKESLVKKNHSHILQPTMNRKSLKKIRKKVSSSSNQKTRTLSSIAIDHNLNSRALYDTGNRHMNGPIKPESSGPTTVACIPVKLVFSRLLEKINRPPSKVSSS